MNFLVRDFSFGRSLLHTTSAVNTKPAGKPDDYFDPWENPERDYVNFPTRRQLQTNLPVRHVIIPESFFKAFHAKTGVTGPYAFLTGLTTFLVSKKVKTAIRQDLTSSLRMCFITLTLNT